MATFFACVKLIIGGALLIWGADLLVSGASNIARRFGLSSLFIGLTVVAFGTSAPELVVSLFSVYRGTYDLAVGNVIGSNIANILIIIGFCAIVKPLIVDRQILKFDLPIMIIPSTMAWYFCFGGKLAVIEGVILSLSFVLYLFAAWLFARKNGIKDEDELPLKSKFWYDFLITIGGLIALVFGSRFVVDGASFVAKACGVSDLLIGLTIVSVGTSLPEIATSVVATARGKCDLAIGNVVGSNITNILLILGISTIVSNGHLNIGDIILNRDLPAMMLSTVVCLPIFFTGLIVAKWEGAVLLLGYVFYIAICASAEFSQTSHKSFLMFFYIYIAFSFLIIAWSVLKEFEHKKMQHY